MGSERGQTQTGGREASEGFIPGDYSLAVGMPETEPPNGWKWTKLSDLARLETGHTPSRKFPEYWDGDVCWIGIRDATANHGRTIYDTNQHTTELGIENSSARLLPKETVCLSRTASVGYVIVMGKEMATSQDFVNWVCSDELDHQFLKYILLSENRSFLRFASGTTHQTIYFPEVKAFHICHPPLPEQKAIAHILGTLDDKIELNRRMNATLEGMAQALFKSWFVDFDPVIDNALAAGNPIPDELAPRAEVRKNALASSGEPSRTNGTTQQGSLDHPTLSDPKSLFPAAFEFTEEMGWIPEGWEMRPLDKIAHYQNGLALQKFRPKDGETPMPVVKIAQLKTGEPSWEEFASPSIKPECILNDGDVVFSWSGSLMVTLWCGGQAALNQHLFKVTSQDYPRWFFLEWTKKHLEDFQRIAADKAVTMGHIKRSHLSEAMCLVPSATLIQEGSRIILPIIDRLISNELESRTLTKLRDTLLPKLISGELCISEAEQLTEEALT